MWGSSETTACSGGQADLLETLGPLRVTHLTPEAFPPVLGSPTSCASLRGLQGALVAAYPRFQMKGDAGKGEATAALSEALCGSLGVPRMDG